MAVEPEELASGPGEQGIALVELEFVIEERESAIEGPETAKLARARASGIEEPVRGRGELALARGMRWGHEGQEQAQGRKEG